MSDYDMMPSSVRIDMAPSAFAILCAVFSKNERLNAILIQSAESLHRFIMFHGILFINKKK